MYHLFIDTYAGGSGKAVKTEEGRLCAVGDNEFLDLTVNELSCDTFANMFTGKLSCKCRYPSGITHFLNFCISFYDNHYRI